MVYAFDVCVRVRVRARARACVRVCVCVCSYVQCVKSAGGGLLIPVQRV